MNWLDLRTLAVLTVAALMPMTVHRAAETDLPSIADRTRGMIHHAGFVPVYYDTGGGRLFIEIPQPNLDMIYLESLATGLGSNDIGLDRSQIGASRLVAFERVGPQVLLVQSGDRFRADSPDPDERRAVQESFARSVLWGFRVEAAAGNRILVDATDFVLRDAHDVIGTLRRTGQGKYKVDRSRSAPYLPATRAFPDNSEIEVTLTLTWDEATDKGEVGDWVREVAPAPESLTVRLRHSFVALPEPGYEPRRNRPGAGYSGLTYADYAAPIGEPIARNLITRHRLVKKDPSAPVSEAVEPIVYYLDPGVPEPVRGALLDGARWWADAFEAIGYRDAFRVEILPDGADPLDVRYNVIQWVHRATRGWSYGRDVIDPRTGEIIKGHVLLGSLRVRQDYLLAEGLLAPYATGDEHPAAALEMALARIRQLSAHEVGHTLGLAHNYLASTQGRASVMDYPHPLVRLAEDGSIDLSDAYSIGVGRWDRVAIAYGYQHFPDTTDEADALDGILAAARGRGINFLTDQDARPPGSPHPLAHLWDNGPDPVAELDRILEVRRAALDRFGEAVVRRGEPLALLEEALVPLYLRHRYQVEAVSKLVGGQWYTYALRGDGQEPLRPVAAADQGRALDALLRTLQSKELVLPAAVLETLPPRPFTYPPHRELFRRYTGLAFDAVAPAAVAADLTVVMILQPERAARLVEQHALDGDLPGLGEVIDRLIESTFGERPGDGYRAEVNRAVERVVANRLMELAATAPMPQVRAVGTWKLEQLRSRLQRDAGGGDDANRAHAHLLAADIGRFLNRDYDPTRMVPPPEPPPGSPIGAGQATPM